MKMYFLDAVKMLNDLHIYFSFYSVIIMRFALASRLGCVYLSPTTGYSLAPSPRVKQRSRLLKSLLKSQVKR